MIRATNQIAISAKGLDSALHVPRRCCFWQVASINLLFLSLKCQLNQYLSIKVLVLVLVLVIIVIFCILIIVIFCILIIVIFCILIILFFVFLSFYFLYSYCYFLYFCLIFVFLLYFLYSNYCYFLYSYHLIICMPIISALEYTDLTSKYYFTGYNNQYGVWKWDNGYRVLSTRVWQNEQPWGKYGAVTNRYRLLQGRGKTDRNGVLCERLHKPGNPSNFIGLRDTETRISLLLKLLHS